MVTLQTECGYGTLTHSGHHVERWTTEVGGEIKRRDELTDCPADDIQRRRSGRDRPMRVSVRATYVAASS